MHTRIEETPDEETLEEKSTPAELFTGTLDEAWPETILENFQPNQVGGIILSYLGGEVDANENRYKPSHLAQFSLLGINATHLKLPHYAMKLLLSLNFAQVITLADQNPKPLTETISSVKDPQGRTLENISPFRAVFALGADIFGVGKCLAAFLPPKEVKEELNKQFPQGWEAKTSKRMKKYSDEAIKFARKIINATVPENSTAAIECKEEVDNYRLALQKVLTKDVISTGRVFTLEPLIAVRQFILLNSDQLGGWTSEKADLFWTVGYGSLVALASSSVYEPLIQHGICNVNNNSFPRLNLRFAEGVGDEVFIDDIGGPCGRAQDLNHLSNSSLELFEREYNLRLKNFICDIDTKCNKPSPKPN